MRILRHRLVLTTCCVGMVALAVACGSSGAGKVADRGAIGSSTTTNRFLNPPSSNSTDTLLPTPAKVRVVNLASGTDGTGQAIDVWAGSGPGGGSSKKLATVAYSKTSDELTPLRSKYSEAQEKNGKKVFGYQLWVLPKGATKTDAGISVNGDAFPGDEMTVIAYTNPDANTERTLAFTAYFSKVTTPRDDLHSTFEGMDAPSGSKLVAVDAHGLHVPAYDPSNPDIASYDLAQSAKCLPELKAKGAIAMDTNSRSLFSQGSTADYAYVVPSDANSVDVTKSPTGVTTDPACSHKVATIDLPASAGDRVLVLLYGDPGAPKALVQTG